MAKRRPLFGRLARHGFGVPRIPPGPARPSRRPLSPSRQPCRRRFSSEPCSRGAGGEARAFKVEEAGFCYPKRSAARRSCLGTATAQLHTRRHCHQPSGRRVRQFTVIENQHEVRMADRAQPEPPRNHPPRAERTAPLMRARSVSMLLVALVKDQDPRSPATPGQNRPVAVGRPTDSSLAADGRPNPAAGSPAGRGSPAAAPLRPPRRSPRAHAELSATAVEQEVLLQDDPQLPVERIARHVVKIACR